MTAAPKSHCLQRLPTLQLAVVLCAVCAVPNMLQVAHAARDLHSTADAAQAAAARDATDVCNISNFQGSNASAFITECTANCLVCEAQGNLRRSERRCVCCKAGYQVSLANAAACAACPLGSFKAAPGISQRCTSCAKVGMTTTSAGSTVCNGEHHNV